MSGMHLRLPAGDGRLAKTMFVRFCGPTAAQIQTLGSSELHALIDWWSARGLAEWGTREIASATLAAIHQRLSAVQCQLVPLPWVVSAPTTHLQPREVPWWPQAGMEKALRLADPPSWVLSSQTPLEERKELLALLAGIAASGGHHLIVVDRYLAANRHNGPTTARFLYSAWARTLQDHGNAGRSPASLTVISSADSRDDSDAAALNAALQSLPRYRQVLLKDFGGKFHDRFIMILADDRAMQFKGNPTVACILLGNGLDTLRGGPSIASVARLPPSACASLAATVTSLIARST